MIGELGSTTDPVVLVPGSVQTLLGDADDLERRAADLDDASDDAARRTVPSWDSETAEVWGQRRRGLVQTLDGVGGIYRTAAVVLRAHAEVVGWAQARAQVAIGYWRVGVDLAAADGAVAFTLRPTGSGPFTRPALPEVDDAGTAYRRQAEVILADARLEVRLSGAACSQVLDEMCEGLPDGRFHFDEFLGGIGDWLVGIGELVYRFNSIRLTIDPAGTLHDVDELGQGIGDIGEYLARNPHEALTLLLNTDQLHDNPGRWWGTVFPDLALTAAGVGAGLGLANALRRGARTADNLTDASRGLPVSDGSPRGLYDQLMDPRVHPDNDAIVRPGYDPHGGYGGPERFADEFVRADPSRPGAVQWEWPPNQGAVPGSEQLRPVRPGESLAVDRIGGPDGSYFSSPDAPFDGRGLPPDRLAFARHGYSVDTTHPLVARGAIQVEQSTVAPAFGQPGGSGQLRFFDSRGAELTVRQLLDLGILSPR